MHRGMLLAAALASGLALAGCRVKDGHDNEVAAADTTATANQIRADEARWNEDWASRDANRVMAHYSEDTTLMAAGRVTGAAQVRQVVNAMVQDPNLELRFNPDKVEVAGDMAYTRGTYSLRTTNPRTRQPQSEAGDYVTIYRRQADGSWKAVEDIIAPRPQASPAPAPAGS